MTLRRLIRLGASVAVALVVACGLALAHTATQDGGPNADTLDGHDHVDWQYGRGQCDDLLGRDDADHGYGGDSGCDVVRGMEGGSDVALVCDDGAGNDQALGGAGSNDICYGSSQDDFNDPSCEFVSLQSTNCV